MTVTSTPALLKQRTQPVTMPNNESVWGRRASMLPSMTWKKGSEVQIVLDGETQFIHSYSTSDEISGNVNIKFEKDTCIDDFAITFQGQTTTWVEKIATTSPTMGRTTGKHTFLRVNQPIDQDRLPEFNRAKAGQVYTIPFEFVVPDRILDFTCNHKVDQDAIKDCHLLLPPSLGDPMLSGRANTLMDDLAPNMSKISYTIRVGLLKASPSVRRTEMVEEHVGIRIVPAREELPPLSIVPQLDRRPGKFCLRKEKNVRKGIFKIGKKQGSLIAEAAQPPSLKLSHPSQEGDEPVTTMTTVQLRFDPSSADEQPPPLSCISSKLNIHTFFGAAPWIYLPAPDSYDLWSVIHSQYPQSIDLSSRNLSNVEWMKHEPGSLSAPTPSRTKSCSLPSQRRQSKSASIPTSNSFGTETRASSSAIDTSLPRRVSTFSSASSDSTSESSDNDSQSSTSSNLLNLSPSSTVSIPSPSTSYNSSLPYYTTSIVVPITLPANSSSSSVSNPPSTTTSPVESRRQSTISTASTSSASAAKHKLRSKPVTFVPTFHSCLVSRVYTLELNVAAHSAPTMHLRLPIQMSLPYQAPPPTTAYTTPPPTSHQTHEWSNPFSPPSSTPTQTEPESQEDKIQLANDEALARALATNNQHSYSSPRDLPDVPEYDFEYEYARPTPVRRAQTDAEAPPEYHSSFRRVSAARHAAAAAAGNNGVGGSGSGSGSGGGSGNAAGVRHSVGDLSGRVSTRFGDSRRRFSLLL